MANAPADLAGKRVIVLSDNERLAQAIELDLSHCLKPEIVTHVLSPLAQGIEQVESDEFDLILVAVSLPTSEPVVMLTKASLVQQIGQVPIIVVSDRLFDPETDCQIFHLSFPVNADALRDRVKEILLG